MSEATGAQEQARTPKKRRVARHHLPWLNVPAAASVLDAVPLESVAGLHPSLRAGMDASGYTSFLPIQAATWAALGGGMSSAHDLCIAAPTGSGKTLAYMLPALNRIAEVPHRPELRALVVVPTRSLARQVYDAVTSMACFIPDCRVALANGGRTVQAEADAIFTSLSSRGNPSLASLLGATQAAFPDSRLASGQSARDVLLGRNPATVCSASVLVATPGRLVEHLGARGPAWLRDLEFLVVDEADRLLRQEYQGWLTKLMNGLQHGNPAGHRAAAHSLRAVKLITSATVTRDPVKLKGLRLHAPRYIAVQADAGISGLPRTLTERHVITSASQKPHALVALLIELLHLPRSPCARAAHADACDLGNAVGIPDANDMLAARPAQIARVHHSDSSCTPRPNAHAPRALIFLSSVAAVRSVAAFLRACRPLIGGKVDEFTSAIGLAEQQAALTRFSKGVSSILVASDAMTRGMHLPGIDFVINYDMPAHGRTYVHRAGRTARVGLPGSVITLLRKEHRNAFRTMLGKLHDEAVQPYRISEGAWETARPHVDAALQGMQNRVWDTES